MSVESTQFFKIRQRSTGLFWAQRGRFKKDGKAYPVAGQVKLALHGRDLKRLREELDVIIYPVVLPMVIPADLFLGVK
jgi:hypothetical protein